MRCRWGWASSASSCCNGSLRLDTIIGDQAASGVWNVFVQPLGFVVFVVAAFAEAARLPFDLPEAEQELIGGYHTEYAGMKLLLFLVAEFLHMITASFLIVILFLGGWHFWGLTGSGRRRSPGSTAILRIVVLWRKMLAGDRVLHAGPLELAAVPLRPAHDPGLEGHAAAGAGEPGGDGGARRAAGATRRSPTINVTAGCGCRLGSDASLAWIAAGLLAPLVTDNRPRRSISPLDAEQQTTHITSRPHIRT